MQYSITLPSSALSVLKEREQRYLRIRIEYDGSEIVLIPDTISCDAAEDYQRWSLTFKNYGEYQEGLFGDCLACVDFSHDGGQWTQIFAGYVPTEGMGRVKGYITDDYVSMELVDRTKTRGMKRKPPQTVLTGFKICDPGNPSKSIIHYLGSLMGIDAFDTSSILDEKDVVVLGNNPVWRELQLLRDAFAADMYFDHLRRLRFRSPHDFSWTEPASEWTFIAHPKTSETTLSSRVTGKITTVRREILCNKADSEIDIYEHRTLRAVYRNTENWNAEANECAIVVPEGESWPREGVASLQYQDPETGEEYPYAVNIQPPSIGRNRANDIYYTGGRLEIVSFNGSSGHTEIQPGASQIILRNTGPTDVVIRKFIIRGEPFYHSKTQKVIEVDGSIVDDVDIVDKSVDGTYATSASQIGKTLKRIVDEGKIRPRIFTFSTIFLPQIQRGMGCTVITDTGEIVPCRLLTYAHKTTGSTIATMRTAVIVTEKTDYSPEYNPTIIESPVIPSVPVQGPPGNSGNVTVVQYCLGGPDGPSEEGYTIGGDGYEIGGLGWVLGESGWTFEEPTPGDGQYVYMRIGSYSPPNESWPTGWRVTRLTGEPARGIRLEASSVTIEFSGRGALRTGDITLRVYLQNVPSAEMVWISPNATLLDVDAVTKTLDVSTITSESIPITVTLNYLGQTYSSTVTISVVYDGKPKAAYFNYHYSQVLPSETPSGDPLISGDTLLYVPRDGLGEWINTDPLFGHVLKWDGDSWESTTDSQSIGTAAKDAFKIARETGKVIYAAVIYTEAMVASNIQVGRGTGLAESGFRFRAMDDDYSQEGTPKVPVFDLYKDDKLLLEVKVDTGEIFFGPHFWYDPATGKISSTDGKVIIHADGVIETTDGIYRGTVRAGRDPALTARLAFRDEIGVGLIGFTGTGVNDLSIVSDSNIQGFFEVKIASAGGVEYNVGESGKTEHFVVIVKSEETNATTYTESRDLEMPLGTQSELTLVAFLAGGRLPTRAEYSAMHPAIFSLPNEVFWTREKDGATNYWYGIATSGGWSFFSGDPVSGGKGFGRVVKFFYEDHDTFQWRHKAGVGDAWSSWSVSSPMRTLTIPAYEIEAQFASYTGHAVGDIWTFDQGEMYGLSGMNRWGHEYIRAERGVITIGNEGKESLNLKDLPTSATGLSSGALWNSDGVIKIVP